MYSIAVWRVLMLFIEIIECSLLLGIELEFLGPPVVVAMRGGAYSVLR